MADEKWKLMGNIGNDKIDATATKISPLGEQKAPSRELSQKSNPLKKAVNFVFISILILIFVGVIIPGIWALVKSFF